MCVEKAAGWQHAGRGGIISGIKSCGVRVAMLLLPAVRAFWRCCHVWCDLCADLLLLLLLSVLCPELCVLTLQSRNLVCDFTSALLECLP